MLETVAVRETLPTRQMKAPMGELRFMEGVLSNLAMLRRIAPAHLASVIRQSYVLAARKGEVIVRRDSRLPGAYVLAYGSVEIALRGAGQERRALRLVYAGETFGKAAALCAKPCRYEAVALLDSKLVVIPTGVITELMDRDPRFARSLALELADDTLRVIGEIEALTLQRGAQRLATYLASLGGNGTAPAPYTVQLPVSKTVVAARLGIKKETLSRLLRDFRDNGLITVTQRNIAILNPGRLAEVARA